MSIYEDIAERTGGNIYVGVVGPVRTGKSTFIKRFMETLVLPRIGDDFLRERARDELPQSGSGRTIMTAEPKFVPEEAVSIAAGDGGEVRVRLIDCVGYMVNGAVGHEENGLERMVTTPWFPEEVPMSVAAETGTRKVITEHATIGIVITTDGSITDIPREDYLVPEGRVIAELRELGKPFIVLLNSTRPDSPEAKETARRLAEENGTVCLPVNCMTLGEEEITDILGTVLQEFPVREYAVFMPDWIEALREGHPIRSALYGAVREGLAEALTVREVRQGVERMNGTDERISAGVRDISLGTGRVSIELKLPRALFYEAVTEASGLQINSDRALMNELMALGMMKTEYEKVADALREVRETGYGVVMPSGEDLTLREPEIVRRGGRYSVRLKATAPSIHMIMTDVETEVNPAVGGEKSSGDMINFLLQEFEGDTGRIWESNIFGKSLHEIAGDSLQSKIRNMPPETRTKLRDTLQRIINDGAGGLICIIL